jgi:hypothetical protein
MAAGGPKSRAVAAAKADIVTLGVGPLASRDEYRALADEVRALVAGRADDLEFASPSLSSATKRPRGRCSSWGPTWPR